MFGMAAEARRAKELEADGGQDDLAEFLRLSAAYRRPENHLLWCPDWSLAGRLQSR